MSTSRRGEFYGSHYHISNFEELTLTDTEYVYNDVDWHSHENPYFTYLLQGKLFESNKKDEQYLEAGSVLFHFKNDAHYNKKPKEYTRGFHIELTDEWFEQREIKKLEKSGSINIQDPLIKASINKVFIESKIDDDFSQLSLDLLLIDVFDSMKRAASKSESKRPPWVTMLKEMLTEKHFDYSLKKLSEELNIHPVYLSRQFHKYFGTTFGKYARQLKLNRAVVLLFGQSLSLTDVAHEAGYYDQSHFISNFKSCYNMTPSSFLKQFRNG